MLYNSYMTVAPDPSPQDTHTVSLAEARADLSRLASLAHYTGQITVLTRYGRPYAVIAPVDAVHLPGTAAAAQPPTSAEEIATDLADASNGSQVTPDDVQAAIRAVREDDDA
jgi:antitoxin (DNA-binding transcriptional repressor) of toxin-antitoxin stability system